MIGALFGALTTMDIAEKLKRKFEAELLG